MQWVRLDLELGLKWGAQTHNGSPSWLRFKPRLSRLQARRSTTVLFRHLFDLGNKPIENKITTRRVEVLIIFIDRRGLTVRENLRIGWIEIHCSNLNWGKSKMAGVVTTREKPMKQPLGVKWTSLRDTIDKIIMFIDVDFEKRWTKGWIRRLTNGERSGCRLK